VRSRGVEFQNEKRLVAPAMSRRSLASPPRPLGVDFDESTRWMRSRPLRHQRINAHFRDLIERAQRRSIATSAATTDAFFGSRWAHKQRTRHPHSPRGASMTVVKLSNRELDRARNMGAVAGRARSRRHATLATKAASRIVYSQNGARYRSRPCRRAHAGDDIVGHFPEAVEQQMRAQALVARVDAELVPAENPQSPSFRREDRLARAQQALRASAFER